MVIQTFILTELWAYSSAQKYKAALRAAKESLSAPERSELVRCSLRVVLHLQIFLFYVSFLSNSLLKKKKITKTTQESYILEEYVSKSLGHL